MHYEKTGIVATAYTLNLIVIRMLFYFVEMAFPKYSFANQCAVLLIITLVILVLKLGVSYAERSISVSYNVEELIRYSFYMWVFSLCVCTLFFLYNISSEGFKR